MVFFGMLEMFYIICEILDVVDLLLIYEYVFLKFWEVVFFFLLLMWGLICIVFFGFLNNVDVVWYLFVFWKLKVFEFVGDVVVNFLLSGGIFV